VATIAITGRKGGVGKTILTNLAAELLDLGHTVVALDSDSQQSLTAWACCPDSWKRLEFQALAQALERVLRP